MIMRVFNAHVRENSLNIGTFDFMSRREAV